MADLKYNFLDNNFVTYQNVETPTVTLDFPLFDEPVDISDWASGVSESGIPIIKRKNLPFEEEVEQEPEEVLVEEEVPEQVSLNTQISFSLKTNAEKVINTLMKDLNLTRQQAAGVAGVLTVESGINPQAFNKGEKAGTYTSSSANNQQAKYGEKKSPWSYGAGIAQWTFTDRKEKALMGGLGLTQKQAYNLITSQGIESLSLEQQIKMLEYELTHGYKNTLEGIKKCQTAAEAAATYHCHAIAGYSLSKDIATPDEVEKMNKRYAKVGAKSAINKGMNYAEIFAR